MEDNFGNTFASPPALVTFRYSSSEHRRLDLSGLKTFLLKFLDESAALRSSDELDREIYVLEKLLYKMNGPFRRHRHFQLAKRLKKLITRCFDQNVGRVKNSSMVTRHFATSIYLDDNDGLRCPSGEYFRFVLVNLRLLAILLARIAKSCVDCCRRTTHMLDMGHFIESHCLLIAVVARFRADCCRRLEMLQNFFTDFKRHGYLVAGLKTKCVDEGAIGERDPYLEVFDDLEGVELILDQEQFVKRDSLSAAARKEAVDYFEELFNVRLVQQRIKQQESKGKLQRKTTSMKFQQALASKNESAYGDDSGVPIKRNCKERDATLQGSTSAIVECLISELERAKTLKSIKKFASRLENANIGEAKVAASRLLWKELKKVEGVHEGDSKKLTQLILKIQSKLRRLLLK